MYPDIAVAVAPAKAFGSCMTGGVKLSREFGIERFQRWPQSVSTRSTSAASALPTSSPEPSSWSANTSGSKGLRLHGVDARPPAATSSEPLAANECAAIAYACPEPMRVTSARYRL